MRDGQKPDSQSFDANYRVLRETADWLAGQDEPKIDELVPKVEAAMQAYRNCKDRLDKVQKTLGKYLRNEDQQEEETGEEGPDGEYGEEATDDDEPF